MKLDIFIYRVKSKELRVILFLRVEGDEIGARFLYYGTFVPTSLVVLPRNNK